MENTYIERPESVKINSWISDYNGWRRGDNPNQFYSKTGEALYIYEDHIKYWEDIRCQQYHKQDFPSKKELFLLID